MKITRISFGIVCYKESKYLNYLLQSIRLQKIPNITITEVIIVSVKEDEKNILKIVKAYKDLKIKLILEECRHGKYNAINLFLKKAKEDILILSSGDIFLSERTVNNLILPFKDQKIGIVSSRPKLTKSNIKNPLGYTINLIWELHHNISLSEPKFGEIIAFRNLKFTIPPTEVDEEMIAKLIQEKNYFSYYAQKALVYNKGPKKIKDYISQRRRIYCGHIKLKYNYGYSVPTLNSLKIIFCFFKYIKQKNFFLIIYSCIIEGYSRILGVIDFLIKKDYTIWKIIEK